MKLKEKLKRLLALGVVAGITMNSIPLSSYAATISTEESEMAVIIEEETEGNTEGQTESDIADEEQVSEGMAETDSAEETESGTEETENGTETETGTETESATENVTETESASEEETQTTVETETETVLETETEVETLEDNSQVIKQIEELEKQAKEALKNLTASEYIMALVYLCDSYDVKAEADFDAQTVESLKSGHTVLIQDVEADTESMTIWYQISFSVDDSTKTGYIPREYLAYSNENFLAWEENYIEPVQLLLNENKAGVPVVYSDGAVNAYSSDVEQFPSSYQSALQTLKNSHPNWTFVKFDTGLDWNTVVYNQLNPKARSLVYYTRGSAWKNGVYEKDSKWYYASEAAVRYCLDPRNGLTDPRIFQFEQLTYNSSYHNVSAIQNILNSTFMKGNVPKGDSDNSGSTISYAQAFYNIGKVRKLSPFHLASRVIQEQGVNGSSPLISGTYSGYEGYYNYFNIGATSDNPIKNGLRYAKDKGWNTPYKSIKGGADTIGNNYILQGQDTLYLQKFDVESQYNGLYSHQYMQNIQAPTTEASTIRNLYNQAGALNGNFVFKIPVYNNMPATACPEPSSESISLSSNEVSLKGGYSVDITYTINDKSSSLSTCVPDDASIASAIKVKDSEKVDSTNNKVTGTITIEGLAPGSTYITLKTTNGATATCKVTVVKDTITLSKTTVDVAAGSSDGTLSGIPVEITYKINNPKSVVKKCTVESLEDDKKEVLTAELIKGEVDENNNLTGTIKLTGITPGKAKVTLTSRYGGTETCTVTVVRLPEEAAMATKELTIGIDDSKNAHVTILPEDTTNKNLKWESSDEKVAVVNASSGRIIGVGVGTATITGTTEEVTLKTGEPLTVTCTVTVVPAVECVEIAADEIELGLKEQETFALDGKIILNGAETSDLYRIEYFSADEEIATVDENGVITPKAAGSTVVTARVKSAYASSGTKSVSCKVSVVPEKKTETVIPDYDYVQPEEIQIYKNETNEEVTANTYVEAPLKAGGMTVLKYVISPADADVEKVIWQSSKAAVARVEDHGDGTATVYAGTKGNAVITVSTDIGIQKQFNVVVEEKQKMTEVSLDKKEAVIYVNGTVSGNDSLSSTVQLHAIPEAVMESGIAYQWSSTDETIAKVDENGKVTAVAPGKAVIVAKDAGGSGKYAKCTVTVERCIEEIMTGVDALYVQPNKKVTVTAQYAPEDYTAAELEWSSSNTAVATVTQKGVVAVQKDVSAGAKAIISVTDKVTGIKKEIPLTVATTACKSVVLYKQNADGKNVKAGAQTLYANGTEAEKITVIKAEAQDAQNKKIENISFYAVSGNRNVADVIPNTDAEGKYDGTFKIVAKGSGSTTIKVYAADGSGKSTSVKVTVKLYAEQIEIVNEAMYLAPGTSGNLEAVVLPADAADKEIVWKFAGSSLKTYQHTENGFVLEPNTGKVTIQNSTKTGTTAEFVAVNKASGAESGTSCVVTVVDKAITKVSLNEKSIVMTGADISRIPEEQLSVNVSPETANPKLLKYVSSNKAVATVDADGKVKATGYGTAVITVSTWDNKKKATCKVTVASMDKGYKLSAVTKNISIQSYASDINSSARLEIKDQNGKIYDNSLFTFTSNKPEVVQADTEGIVTPNASYEEAKDGKATITAILKNDPYKRKVTFNVTVLAKAQAESVSVTALNIRGNDIENTGFYVKYPTETISLKAEALNAYGEALDTKLKWTVSDTSMAAVQVDPNTRNAVLTVKKAGKFYVTCTAEDSVKKSRKIQITAVDTKPVVGQKKIVLNMQGESDEQSYVYSESVQIAADKECPIQNITVKSAKKGQTEVKASNFAVKEVKNGYYAVMIPESSLKNITKGNYDLVLSAEVKGMTELGFAEKITHELTVTLNVTDNKPKISVGTITFNRQDLSQQEAVLRITSTEKPESIELVQNQSNKFDTRFNVEEENGTYKLKFVDNTGYNLNSVTGKALVKVKGYQAQTVNITVKTPSKKVAIAASGVPAMDMKRGREQKISLYNKDTKETLKNYSIEIPSDAKLNIVKNSDGTLTIKPIAELLEKNKYKNGSTVTVTAKVMALSEDGTKELWKEKVSVNISVKVYTVTPKVALGATTIQMNKQAAGEPVETTIRIDRDNVRIADDTEWRIEQYNSRNKEYTVIKDWGELPENTLGNIVLSYDRQSRMLCTSFKEGSAVSTGNYKYRITWIAEDYSLVEGNITVIVVDRAISAKITAKGKLDLLTRDASTMQGTIKLTNTTGKIKSITMLESVASGKQNESFYSSWLGDNTFRIRLREGVKMTTGEKTVPVKIVLEGGTVLYSNVSFKVSQSTPKVATSKTQTIYKSGNSATVCYDMNTQIPDGYEINTIKAVSVPDGIGVTIENGRIFVSLADRYLKPGTYSIKVNIYFNGAQDVDGSDYGKAVQKSLKVTVK